MTLGLTKNTKNELISNCSLPCCYSLWQYTGGTMCFAAIKYPSYGNGIENFFFHLLAFPPTNYYASCFGYSGDFFTMYRAHSEEFGTVGRGELTLAIPNDEDAAIVFPATGEGSWFENYNIPKSRTGSIAFKFQQLTENSSLKFYYSVDNLSIDDANKIWIETSHTRNGDFVAIEVTTILLGDPKAEPVTLKVHFLLPDFSLGLQMPGRPSTQPFYGTYATVTDSTGCFEKTYDIYGVAPGVDSWSSSTLGFNCNRKYYSAYLAVYKYLFATFGYYILFPSVYGVADYINYNELGEYISETWLNIDFREDVYQYFDGEIFYFHCSASSADRTGTGGYIGAYPVVNFRNLGNGTITITT